MVLVLRHKRALTRKKSFRVLCLFILGLREQWPPFTGKAYFVFRTCCKYIIHCLLIEFLLFSRQLELWHTFFKIFLFYLNKCKDTFTLIWFRIISFHQFFLFSFSFFVDLEQFFNKIDCGSRVQYLEISALTFRKNPKGLYFYFFIFLFLTKIWAKCKRT